MKYLIVGLGNIGYEYNNTRHNIGFEVLDHLAKKKDLSFETKKLGDITKYKYRGRTAILLKPSTYMNLSGKAVRYWMDKEKIPLDKVLIVLDDLALPFAKLRMRAKGSDAGHNGLKSIEAMLGTSKYARIKCGIGRDFNPGQQVQYVLGKWDDEQAETIDSLCDMAIEYIQSFMAIGTSRTMAKLN